MTDTFKGYSRGLTSPPENAMARRVIGRQIGFAYVGASVLPAACGLLASLVGLSAIMPVVVGHWLTLAQEYGSSYSLAERRLDEFMKAMAKAISNKSQYTGEHIERVTRISMRIAQALGMPDAQQRQLHLGAVVHDLGKIHLPDDILDKPGELTPEELSKVQTHPYKGWEMLEHVEGLAIPRLIIRHHHENWDGSGYPDHLTGKRIPLEARIVALADHWDAITSVRAHRGAIPIDRARDMLHEEAGKKLDPDLVRIFLEKRLWSEDE